MGVLQCAQGHVGRTGRTGAKEADTARGEAHGHRQQLQGGRDIALPLGTQQVVGSNSV